MGEVTLLHLLPEFVGRTAQLTELSTKLSFSLKSDTPLSLYVSGPPGTGKTATVMHTVHKLKVRVVYVTAQNRD